MGISESLSPSPQRSEKSSQRAKKNLIKSVDLQLYSREILKLRWNLVVDNKKLFKIQKPKQKKFSKIKEKRNRDLKKIKVRDTVPTSEIVFESSFDFLFSPSPRADKFQTQGLYCSTKPAQKETTDFLPNIPEILIEDFVSLQGFARRDQCLMKVDEYLPNLSLLESNSIFFIAG